jgi:predicted Ser/Thr protein kinase
MNPKNENGYKSDQVFSKLTDHGYSEKVAEAIWRWYHPSMQIKSVF